jgi:hypothetical protein
MPRVIQVIESHIPRGKGTQDDACRNVVQYHTLEGKFLAERDPKTDTYTYNPDSIDLFLGSRSRDSKISNPL